MKKTRFRSNPVIAPPERVDREKGIIYGVSCNTEGPALGHGVLLEAEFVEGVTTLGNKAPKGIKSRFGHPGMSSEALGTYVGRFKNFRNIKRVDKLRSIADLHIDPSTKNAPGGDRGKYIMDMAENSPDMFATSIVFRRGHLYKRDAKGNKVVRPSREDFDNYEDYSEERSTYRNTDSPEYASIEALTHCDFVDEPAANPDGLFSEDTFAGAAGKFLEDHPAVNEMLKENPDILEELAKDERFDGFFDAHPKIKDIINNKPEAAKSFLDKFNEIPSSDDAETGEEVSLDTYEQFKELHPKFYSKALAEGESVGVTKEKKRVTAHLLLGKKNDAIDIACNAIEDGSGVDDTYIAQYVQAGISKNALSAREEDEKDTDVGDLPEGSLNEKDTKVTQAFQKLATKRGIDLKGGK